MEETITWQSPPGANDEEDKDPGHARKAAQFRLQPGVWGILTSYPLDKRNPANLLARAVKKGIYKAFAPAGTWDAKTATEPDTSSAKVVNVYVKYLGQKE